MSEVVANLALQGAEKIIDLTETRFQEILAAEGAEEEIVFLGTGYFFPASYALLGLEVKTLGDIPPVLQAARELRKK